MTYINSKAPAEGGAGASQWNKTQEKSSKRTITTQPGKDLIAPPKTTQLTSCYFPTTTIYQDWWIAATSFLMKWKEGKYD